MPSKALKKPRKRKCMPNVWSVLQHRLDEVRDLASEGLFDKEIAERFGLLPVTFAKAKREHPELAEALDEGRIVKLSENIGKIEDSLFKRACGYDVEEVVTETKLIGGKRVNGKIEGAKEQVVKKVTVKHIPGDTQAAIFILRTLCPQIYNKGINDTNIQINQYEQIIDDIPEETMRAIEETISGVDIIEAEPDNPPEEGVYDDADGNSNS